MQIQDLTPAQIVQSGVLPAIADGLVPARVADFLAEVDWSCPTSGRRDVIDLLGRLEAWSTELAEGELAAGAYRDRLVRLVAESGLPVAG